jgi:hypothetical protein
MSSFEQETIASVTQLHELRTAAETYESFYQLYGLTELQRKGFSTILSRVLHIDETEDRSIHFVVAQAEVLQLPIRRRYNNLRVPMHYIPYNSSDILIASTNGNSITEYEVVDAEGTYREYLNCTDKQYNPVHETMKLAFTTNAINRLIRAEFNVASGNGTVELGEQPCGWILSETESSRIRDIILTPALPDPEPADHHAEAS